MKVYVLSFSDNHNTYTLGVFTSGAKAITHMEHSIMDLDDLILDSDTDTSTWRFFTKRGTYVIERMLLIPDADY